VNWPSVIQRALETSTRAATATALRHLFGMAEISRLKRKADVEVRVVSIPVIGSRRFPEYSSKRR
jgi:hypothetical protein